MRENSHVIIKKCPRCHKKAFRRLDIFGDSIMWKCKKCAETGREKLFRIEKKIIYLDQFGYSNILKSTLRNNNDKWNKLGDRIRELVEDQIIVCPYSTVHQTETEFYETYYKEITDLYRNFSAGIAFKHPHRIEQNQILQSLLNFLSEDDSKPHEFPWKNALHSNPHKWSSRFSVFTNIRIDLSEIKKRSAMKEETRGNMKLH